MRAICPSAGSFALFLTLGSAALAAPAGLQHTGVPRIDAVEVFAADGLIQIDGAQLGDAPQVTLGGVTLSVIQSDDQTILAALPASFGKASYRLTVTSRGNLSASLGVAVGSACETCVETRPSEPPCDESVTGKIYFDTTTRLFRGCTGASWVSLSAPAPPPPPEDPFEGDVKLTFERTVAADWSQFPDNNVWGAVFVDGTLYVHVLAHNAWGVGRYDMETDTLVKLFDTSGSLGMGWDGANFVLGSESGCAQTTACFRRYTPTGAYLDETPLFGISGGLRGVASRGSEVFMLAATPACDDYIGLTGVDFAQAPPTSSRANCVGVTNDRAVTGTQKTFITGTCGDGWGGVCILNVYGADEIANPVLLPGYPSYEITALAYEPASQTLVVVARTQFTFYHVEAR